jgi:hypothetical protein
LSSRTLVVDNVLRVGGEHKVVEQHVGLVVKVQRIIQRSNNVRIDVKI